MCGFAGILDPKGASPGEHTRLVRRMAEAIRNRGPDDDGEWFDSRGQVAFGFRRLAILDLSSEGHQPMVSADGRLVSVFNGEIYNFAELRLQLERFGHVFRGGSDTEVM